jgi:hypothetical protein
MTEGSFVRWQAITITQLGYAVNLVLTFATASLGFVLSMVKDRDFTPNCWGRCFLDFSGLALGVSVAVGLWCVVNRLSDFRVTAKIARFRQTWPERKEPLSIRRMRRTTKKLGKLTWQLFCWQVSTFAVGVLALMSSFAAAYRSKLF